MASKKKGLKLEIKPDDISYTNIHRSNNYNSASIGIKRADNEYMSISYEWSGDSTPDFVMDLMGFMQSNKKVIENSSAKDFTPSWRDEK